MKLLLQVKDRYDAWNTVGSKDQLALGELSEIVARAELLQQRDHWINSGYFPAETTFRIIRSNKS